MWFSMDDKPWKKVELMNPAVTLFEHVWVRVDQHMFKRCKSAETVKMLGESILLGFSKDAKYQPTIWSSNHISW